MSDDTIKLQPGYKKTREEEQLLRAFTSIDGPKGATEAYKEGWERIFGGRGKLEEVSEEAKEAFEEQSGEGNV